MDVYFTKRFERAFAELTKAERQIVRKAITLLGDNPRYPSLHVKKMEGRDIWEARPSSRLRMTFKMSGEVISMRNLGEHDKVLRNP